VVPLMNKWTRVLVEKWAQERKNIDIDIDMARLTLDIILYIIFGKHFKIITNDASTTDPHHLGEVLLILLSEVGGRVANPIHSAVTAYPANYIQAKKQFDFLCNQMIQDAKNNDPGEAFVIHYLIDPKEGLTTQQIADEVMVMLFAGHDTTAHSMSWFVYEVINNPDILNKLQTEIRSLIGNGDTSVESANKMKYLDQVWKEVLRHYPAAPTGSDRLVTEQIKVGKYTIPVNTSVWIAPYAIHHSPLNYENPNTFDPDRWNEERRSKIHPYAFLPFSKGSRNCLGQPLANLESKIVLSQLFKDCTFKLSQGSTVTQLYTLTLRPNGLKMDIEQTK